MSEENDEEWFEVIFHALNDLDTIWNGSDVNGWVEDFEQLILIRMAISSRIKEIKALILGDKKQ